MKQVLNSIFIMFYHIMYKQYLLALEKFIIMFYYSISLIGSYFMYDDGEASIDGFVVALISYIVYKVWDYSLFPSMNEITNLYFKGEMVEYKQALKERMKLYYKHIYLSMATLLVFAL